MRTRWVGVFLVVIAAAGILIYKRHRSSREASPPVTQSASSTKPDIILVADLREADQSGDNCAEIIRLVREAGRRGVKVEELPLDSDSPLLKQYHILTNPTVLIFDHEGKVAAQFEGESSLTIKEIRNRLASLSEAQR